MAIGLFCSKCRKSYKLKTEVCQSCGRKLGSKYRIQVKASNGKFKSKVVESLSLARKLESKYKTQAVMDDEFGNKNQSPIIDDAFKQYLRWAKFNKASYSDDKQRWRDHIKPHLSGSRFHQISTARVQKIVDGMMTSTYRRGDKDIPYSPATVKQTLQLVKRLFNFSRKQGLYKGPNPCDGISLPRFDNRLNDGLTQDSLEDFLPAVHSMPNERAKLVILFGLYSGKRLGEILRLQWDDVNINDGLIILRKTKSRKVQSLPLNRKCRDILRRAAEIRMSSYVFPCSTGRYYHSFNKVWQRFKKRHGFKLRFHSLRHSYASFLASSGKVTLHELQQLLGHNEISQTLRYAHLFPETLRRAAEVADEAFPS